MSVILEINTFHAGASAVIIVDGKPVVAIAEERLNRIKYYAKFPTLAIHKCLDIAGLSFRDIDHVAIGRDSSANIGKKIEIKYVLKKPTKLLNRGYRLLQANEDGCAGDWVVHLPKE